MDTPKTILKSKIEKLPKTIGIYLFYEKNPTLKIQHPAPIYIGKAINIKNRVKNHFFQPSYRDNLFIKRVIKIGFLKTNSEIEALILEASLIKKYQPKFNVVWRDDKNYFYIAIAQNKNKIPYLFITHQPNKSKIINHKSKINYVGPFIEGAAIKKTLKFLRRVFPFYSGKWHPKNRCAWCHLELCPGPSPDLEEYRKNIKKLILILKGKRKIVLNNLKKEMKSFSNSQEFEEAAKIRNRILALQKVMSHAKITNNDFGVANNQSPIMDGRSLLETNSNWNKTKRMLRRFLKIKDPISKIECYDISNLQGKYATGSMVVFVNGKPDKSQYKKFKIKMKQEPNDIAMLKEVLQRRLLHPEWGYPEVMLIDGGIGQLNIGIKTKNESLTNFAIVSFVRQVKNIKIISIAKGKRELFIEGQKNPIPLKNLPQNICNLILHLDDQAHRFAITYHKKLRNKNLFQ